jgi:hypothetical protein
VSGTFFSVLLEGLSFDVILNRDEGKDAKARRAVRANNFTQQTNTLDVDKHMCPMFLARRWYAPC